MGIYMGFSLITYTTTLQQMSLFIYYVCKYSHRIISWECNCCVKMYIILNVIVIAKLPSAVFMTDAQNIKQGVTTKVSNLKKKSKCLAEYPAHRITILMTSVKRFDLCKCER